MKEAVEKSKEISDIIKNSSDYQEYLELKSKVCEDSALKEKINNYKTAQVAFQTKIMNGEIVSFEEEKSLSKMYTELEINLLSRSFLLVENKLLSLLNDIYENIGDSLEIEIEL